MFTPRLARLRARYFTESRSRPAIALDTFTPQKRTGSPFPRKKSPSFVVIKPSCPAAASFRNRRSSSAASEKSSNGGSQEKKPSSASPDLSSGFSFPRGTNKVGVSRKQSKQAVSDSPSATVSSRVKVVSPSGRDTFPAYTQLAPRCVAISTLSASVISLPICHHSPSSKRQRNGPCFQNFRIHR